MIKKKNEDLDFARSLTIIKWLTISTIIIWVSFWILLLIFAA